MGKLVIIRRVFKERLNPVYHVSTNDFVTPSFYLEINSRENKLSFFLESDMGNPIYIMDLNDPEKIVTEEDVYPLNRGLIWTAFGKVVKAIEKNEFPEGLDYAA